MNLTSRELRMTSNIIDPTFIARMQRAVNARAVVEADGSVTIHGERLVFADKVVSMAPGTEVEVSLGYRSFSCMSVADIEAFLAQKKAEELEKKEIERIRRNIELVEAIAFNGSLPIPVKWKTEIKLVMSGLSANSNGCGSMKSTVLHVYLLEDMQVGRLKRNAGDFLCTNNDPKWRAFYDVHGDNEDSRYGQEAKVTCKACLAIVERMSKSAAKE